MATEPEEYDGPEPGAVEDVSDQPGLSEDEAKAENEAPEIEDIETEVNTYG